MIHLDADPEEIGRNYEALRLVGDARTTLAALLEALRAGGLETRRAARAGLEAPILAGRQKHEEEAKPLLESIATPIRRNA